MNQDTIVYPAYRTETAPPRNLQPGDKPLFANSLAMGLPAITVSRVQHAQVLKDIVTTVSPLHFYTAASRIMPVKKRKILKRLTYLLLPAQQLDRAVWISHEWALAYYHWFADALCRLVAACPVADKAVPVLLPQAARTFPYIVESLEMLGYTPFYYKARRVMVKELVLPSQASHLGLTNKTTLNLLRARLARVPAQPPHRKVFISRAKARVRRILNETALQALLQEHGYETHFMEDYTLAQQIALMAESRVLVGLHGAGLTNMLFMQPGAQVLELRNVGDAASNCFFTMASDLQHRYYYTANQGDRSDTYDVSVTANLEALKAALLLMEREA